ARIKRIRVGRRTAGSGGLLLVGVIAAGGRLLLRMLLDHRRRVAAAKGKDSKPENDLTTFDLPPSQCVSFEVGGAERGRHPQTVQLGGDGPLPLVDRRTVAVVDRVVVGVGVVASGHRLIVFDLFRLIVLILIVVVERLAVVFVVG